MPTIINRLSHLSDEPCLPLTDTVTAETNDYPIVPGLPPPGIGAWLDSRFCTCGAALNPREVEENLEPALSVKTICSACEARDYLNVCRIAGVIRPLANPESIDCIRCYKYLHECSTGYCVYVAIMTDHPTEIKVGTTKLSRVDTRVREGGYAALSVFLPKSRSYLSLPEADYIEKKVIDGLQVKNDNGKMSVNQYFYRKVGYVGKDETKANTLKAFKLLPSDSLREECETLAHQVLSAVKSQKLSESELLDLELDQTYLNGNDFVDFNALAKVDLSQLRPLERRVTRGRPYRELPATSTVVGVKGACVLVFSPEDREYYSILFDRRSYQGREAFDPSEVLPERQTATLLQWMGGQ